MCKYVTNETKSKIIAEEYLWTSPIMFSALKIDGAILSWTVKKN